MDCPVLGAPPPSDESALAAQLVDGPPDLLNGDPDMEELFFGLDRDVREAIASGWFGHEGPIDDALLSEEEKAAADEDDASDGSAELDPAAAAGEPPSFDDSVAPKGCTLRDYASQTVPGQSFWLARLPRGAPPFEGTMSKTVKFANDDPVEEAAAKAFAAAWLQRWSDRGPGSGGGGSASSGGAAGA